MALLITLFVLFCLFLLGIAIYSINSAITSTKFTKELESKLYAKYGEPTKVIYDEKSIYVFEPFQIIVINGVEYGFDAILDFSVNGSQSYKVTTSTSSALGRGVAGAVLFGGIGALAGAGTASKKVNAKETEYRICITTKDLANPMITYRTTWDKAANELVSVLRIIIDRSQMMSKTQDLDV